MPSGRWAQEELGFDVAALLEQEAEQGVGAGLALTANWMAIAPVTRFTQDALDFGNELPAPSVPGRVRARGAPRQGRPKQQATIGQVALF